MTRLKFRTLRETMAESLALLPEAGLWLPILNRADENGILPEEADGEAVLKELGLEPAKFHAWQSRPWFVAPSWFIKDVAELHEFWVSQQEDL